MESELTQRQPIIITGMHRSGTSCLTGSLAQTNLYLGEVNTDAPHNKKGNYENYAIMELHQAILAANYGSWHEPPQTILWSDDHKKWRDQLTETYPPGKVWGFKDPRSLVLLDGWLEKFPNARIVGSFRHPIAVAKSLSLRNGFTFEKSFSMWMFYNLKLFHYISERGGELICFDHRPQIYKTQLSQIVSRLNLKPPEQGFNFFEQRLRVNSGDSHAQLPEKVSHLYEKLCKMASTEKQ